MPSPDYYIAAGDHGQTLAEVLRDAAGNPVDLTNATVRLLVQPTGGGDPIINAAASNDQVDDDTRGSVSYIWQNADAEQAGFYLGRWVVNYEGGAVQHFPNAGYLLIQISADGPTAADRFADSTDLQERFGILFTADEHLRANGLLEKASGLIRAEVGQYISLVEDDVLVLPGTLDEQILLPERPVIAVSGITLDGRPLAEGSAWYLDGNAVQRVLASAAILVNGVLDDSLSYPYPLGTGFGWPQQRLEITYTHGYEEIPGLVKATCLEMVVRVWVNPGSVARETEGNTSTVYDNMRFSPVGLLLTDDERRALHRFFGWRARSITIQ